MNVRCYNPDWPKGERVKNWPGHGSPPRLFPIAMLWRNDEVLLCEGELDALAAISAGVPAVSTTGGATYWHKNLSLRFNAHGKRAAVAYDCDIAGRTGRKKPLAGIKHSWAVDLDATRKDGYDITEYLREHSADDLRSLIETERPHNIELRSELQLERLSDVKEEKQEWLWPPVIPLGAPTMYEGDPDVGKTMTWIDIVARLSNGQEMPDGTSIPGPVNIIIVAPEDNLRQTIKPRLRAAGADMDRIWSVKLQRDNNGHLIPLSLPEDLNKLSDLIAKVKASLIIFDPITAFPSEKIHSHTNTSLRKMLTPITGVLEERRCAALMIRHLNQDGDLKAIYRGTGSNAYLEVARAGLAIAYHPDDLGLPQHERRRVLAQTKGNLVGQKLSRIFNIVVDAELGIPRVEWQPGHADIDADSALKGGRDSRKNSPKLEDAKRVLSEILSPGPMRVQGTEEVDGVKELIKKAGLTWGTVERAADDMGVVKEPVRHETGPNKGKPDYWKWSLPMAGTKIRIPRKEG